MPEHDDLPDLTPEQIAANIRAARTWHGIPPEQHLLPYRNFRHLLSLQASASPDKVFLIAYDEAGERREYTYAQFNGLVHQTAHFLYDDLDVRRGDRVAIFAENTPETLIICCACWLFGASVVLLSAIFEDERQTFLGNASKPRVMFIRPSIPVSAKQFSQQVNTLTDCVLIGQAAHDIEDIEAAPIHLRTWHFETEIANRPNTFVAPHEPTMLDDQAILTVHDGVGNALLGLPITIYSLLLAAQSVANACAFTGNQKLLVHDWFDNVVTIVYALLIPLISGASCVINRWHDPIWLRLADEHVHLAFVDADIFAASTHSALSPEAAKMYKRSDQVKPYALNHLRHVICSLANVHIEEFEQFEQQVQVSILTSLSLQAAGGTTFLTPFSMQRDERHHWLYQQSDRDYRGILYLGTVVEPYEVEVFNIEHHPKGPDQVGELCIRSHAITEGFVRGDGLQDWSANAFLFRWGWYHTQIQAFYRLDTQGRKHFFSSY